MVQTIFQRRSPIKKKLIQQTKMNEITNHINVA